MRYAALCLLIRNTSTTRQVLLGHKKYGFGVGKYVGIGGGLETGETAVVAAARELKEEVGIDVACNDLSAAGHITFLFPAKPTWNHYVYLFTAQRWRGEPVASDEIEPLWVDFEQIPFDKMWDDSSHWLPQVLDGAYIDARFIFHDDNENVAESAVEILKKTEIQGLQKRNG